jgi:hypothetical protein
MVVIVVVKCPGCDHSYVEDVCEVLDVPLMVINTYCRSRRIVLDLGSVEHETCHGCSHTGIIWKVLVIIVLHFSNVELVLRAVTVIPVC